MLTAVLFYPLLLPLLRRDFPVPVDITIFLAHRNQKPRNQGAACEGTPTVPTFSPSLFFLGQKACDYSTVSRPCLGFLTPDPTWYMELDKLEGKLMVQIKQ